MAIILLPAIFSAHTMECLLKLNMRSFEKRFEDKKWLIFTSFLVIFIVLKSADSFYRPFSFDELFTWQIAQMPTLTRLWEALGPMDPSPPLYYIVTRLSQTAFGYGEFATRLPALISMLVALFFLFLILDRRCGAITALTGVLLLSLSPATSLTPNARTYTFILALCTISLWCWQVAVARPRRLLPLLGLFISLSMALYSHFYAFLLFVPIVAGETYRSFKIRRIDWQVLLTLLLATATIIPLIPLAERCTSLSKGFWSKPTLSTIFLCCNYIYMRLVIVVLIAFGISICSKYIRKENNGQLPEQEVTIKQLPAVHEVVAAISLALTPALGLIVAVCITNAFTARYFVSAVLGTICVLAYSRHLIKRPWVFEGTILMIITAVMCLAAHTYLIHSAIEINRNLKSRINNMLNTGDDLPIVMLSSLSFLETQHYAPESLKKQLFYLIDYDLKFNYEDEDNSSVISIAGLAGLKLINVDDFHDFLKTHKTFYIDGNKSHYMSRLKPMLRPSDVAAIIENERVPTKYLLKVSLNQ